MKQIVGLIILVAVVLNACSPIKNAVKPKQLTKHLEDSFYANQFVGFSLYDPQNKKELYSYQSDKYFIPASNVKIVTLFSALNILGDSIAALKYSSINDSLFIKGTGNPTLLHPYFKDSTAIHFLASQSQPNIILQASNFEDSHFAPGWAWEDYDSYFSPERSALPIYGNVLTAYLNKDSLRVQPEFMRPFISLEKKKNSRNLLSNSFFINPQLKDTTQIPFIVNDSLVAELLTQASGKKVGVGKEKKLIGYSTLYGIKLDTLLKEMMVESDNFLAEQLLLLCSNELSDTLSFNKTRSYVLSNLLGNLSEKPRWVDGSGLSRYNLFTPNSFVQILDLLYQNTSEDRLFQFFPKGGINGTLKENFLASTPYIIAKSGSLGNTYNLSGYLKAKSGKILIFSFMNNHYKQPTSQVKDRMEQLLKAIYLAY
jgi:D-alanyl-D-alanine carboxypeptidase/D-alanyl-D-alanine-endopeptidase (penicillin-binding protein 4)